jgi:ubiquinone/menaquinone biosynthesis C-methylase UbiE
MNALRRFLPTLEALQPTGAYQFASWASASQYLKAYSLVDRYFDKNERVLDWGAGHGHFTRHLIEEHFAVTPFVICEDPAFRTVVGDEAAKSLVVDENPVRLPFDSESFGAATSIGVLEHVRETGGNESDSLQELHRVLKPGGKLLVYHLPNKYSWIEWIAKRVPGKHHHEFRYTNATITDLVAAAGFELLYREQYGVIPRLSLRRLPNHLGLVNWVNALDNAAARVCRPISQNYVLVLQKI